MPALRGLTLTVYTCREGFVLRPHFEWDRVWCCCADDPSDDLCGRGHRHLGWRWRWLWWDVAWLGPMCKEYRVERAEEGTTRLAP